MTRFRIDRTDGENEKCFMTGDLMTDSKISRGPDESKNLDHVSRQTGYIED